MPETPKSANTSGSKSPLPSAASTPAVSSSQTPPLPSTSSTSSTSSLPSSSSPPPSLSPSPVVSSRSLSQTSPSLTSSALAASRRLALTGELSAVCAENGISPSQFVSSCDRVTELDVFNARVATPFHDRDDSGTLSWLSHFPRLASLTVMRQPLLTSLDTVMPLNYLTSLWLTDCSLTAIAPTSFQSLTSLSSLHLSGNVLTDSVLCFALDPVRSTLVQLWCNDNALTSTSPFHSLPLLTSLWLARNKITRIGPHLTSSCDLATANFSDNRIGCFKELLNLSSLPNLRSLALTDPHFGTNPVTALCNYQTYALYHLPHLTLLDNAPAPDHAKNQAQSVYMKKKMYYNMRAKTLKRNATNVGGRAGEVHGYKVRRGRGGRGGGERKRGDETMREERRREKKTEKG